MPKQNNVDTERPVMSALVWECLANTLPCLSYGLRSLYALYRTAQIARTIAKLLVLLQAVNACARNAFPPPNTTATNRRHVLPTTAIKQAARLVHLQTHLLHHDLVNESSFPLSSVISGTRSRLIAYWHILLNGRISAIVWRGVWGLHYHRLLITLTGR